MNAFTNPRLPNLHDKAREVLDESLKAQHIRCERYYAVSLGANAYAKPVLNALAVLATAKSNGDVAFTVLVASLRRYDDDSWDNLRTAEADATTLAVFLEGLGYKLPPHDVVPPGVCTRAVMEHALTWLCEVSLKADSRTCQMLLTRL